MPQPGKGSAGKPITAEPISAKGAPAPKNNGVQPPVGIIKGTRGK